MLPLSAGLIRSGLRRLSIMIAALARGDVVDLHLVPDQIVSFGWMENFPRPHQTLRLREDRRDPAAYLGVDHHREDDGHEDLDRVDVVQELLHVVYPICLTTSLATSGGVHPSGFLALPALGSGSLAMFAS